MELKRSIDYQESIHFSSTYPFSIITCPALRVMGCWSLSQLPSGEGRVQPWESRQYRQTNTHIHTDGQFRAASLPNLHPFERWEGKLEYLKGT